MSTSAPPRWTVYSCLGAQAASYYSPMHLNCPELRLKLARGIITHIRLCKAVEAWAASWSVLSPHTSVPSCSIDRCLQQAALDRCSCDLRVVMRRREAFLLAACSAAIDGAFFLNVYDDHVCMLKNTIKIYPFPAIYIRKWISLDGRRRRWRPSQ